MLVILFEYHLKKINIPTKKRENLITIAHYFLLYLELNKAKIHEIDNEMIKNYFIIFKSDHVSDSERLLSDIDNQKEDLRLFLCFMKDKIKIKCDESDIEGIR